MYKRKIINVHHATFLFVTKVADRQWRPKETFFFKISKGLFSSNFGPKCSKFGPSALMDILFDNLLVATVKSIKRLLLVRTDVLASLVAIRWHLQRVKVRIAFSRNFNEVKDKNFKLHTNKYTVQWNYKWIVAASSAHGP